MKETIDSELLITALKTAGVKLDPGLTDAEVAAIERTFGIRFPHDLKRLLQHALPVGDRFPNWRQDSQELRDQLNWPIQGIFFDIEQSDFWWPGWGAKPASLTEALSIAAGELWRVPILIPIYGHRYIPMEPQESGNPIFSVYQTDIIYHGCNLADYLHNEFALDTPTVPKTSPRPIRFWDEVIER